ncbi:MAG: Coenzyme F420 hydrogenase/dehydrogenase, beta subunit C-terminal domain, partial [Bacillota bacterium]
RKIVAILGIFCAGTPATAGVLQLLSKLEVSPESVREIGFRGNGWPGYFSVKQLYGPGISRLSYEESWGFLQAFRPFRCFVCPDGTSEFADISFGDPWYRAIDEHELGRSLIIARSPLGVRIINSAEKAGYISIKEVGLQILEYSQYNLLMKRRAIWGRLLAMRLFGLPVPQYKGFSLHKSWSELDFAQKGISLIGTGRRILRRKLYHSVKWKC